MFLTVICNGILENSNAKVDAFEKALTKGVKQEQTFPEILAGLCLAEAAERKVRSIQYQMRITRFPVAKDLDGFKFEDSPINESLIRELMWNLQFNKEKTAHLQATIKPQEVSWVDLPLRTFCPPNSCCKFKVYLY